jgi:uncharacterized protein YecT (DUF1311 family)
MRVLSLLTVLLFAPSAWAADPPAHRPSFDCAKARPGVEQTICGSEELARLDRSMAEQFAKRLATFANAARAEWLAQQRQWLVQRYATCSVALDPAECLDDVYRKRRNQIDAPAFEWASFLCDRSSGRAVLVVPGDATDTEAKALSAGQRLECAFGSLTIRAERKKDEVRLWVNKRLVYSEHVYSINSQRQPNRFNVIVSENVVEFCSPYLSTDRVEGDVRCAPMMRSDLAGPIDYLAYPPDPSAPQPGELVVAYTAVGAWCGSLIRGSEVAPPRGVTWRRWYGKNGEVEGFPHAWRYVAWSETLLFEVGGESYVLWRTKTGESPYRAMVGRSKGDSTRPICRFVSANEQP